MKFHLYRKIASYNKLMQPISLFCGIHNILRKHLTTFYEIGESVNVR